jgi:hypothetical protein
VSLLPIASYLPSENVSSKNILLLIVEEKKIKHLSRSGKGFISKKRENVS